MIRYYILQCEIPQLGLGSMEMERRLIRQVVLLQVDGLNSKGSHNNITCNKGYAVENFTQ